MGYGNDQGIVLKNSYDRYNFNGKIDVTPNRVVSFGISTDFSYQTSKAPSSNVDMFKYAISPIPMNALITTTVPIGLTRLIFP